MAEDLIKVVLSIQVWDVAKIFVCFALLLYIVFAFVVVKQVNLMTETLNQLEFPLKFIAVIHFLVAIFVFILAIIIL